ncbi:MAG: peptide-methionine (S)-S-oxide reductase MsrA, partial [Nitrososphaerota archaeon]|nr:peptide-methionine (S)-S-oxide reductase MsrA [Nitrososphaerota archaeon]
LVTFDPAVIGYADLLEAFFRHHDPTTPNRQGPDVGTQYRSVIFCSDDAQRAEAEKIIRELADENVFRSPIVTEVALLGAFYPAEDYHREYYRRNPAKPYCQAVIAPKLSKFRSHWKAKLKVPAMARGA